MRFEIVHGIIFHVSIVDFVTRNYQSFLKSFHKIVGVIIRSLRLGGGFVTKREGPEILQHIHCLLQTLPALFC